MRRAVYDRGSVFKYRTLFKSKSSLFSQQNWWGDDIIVIKTGLSCLVVTMHSSTFTEHTQREEPFPHELWHETHSSHKHHPPPPPPPIMKYPCQLNVWHLRRSNALASYLSMGLFSICNKNGCAHTISLVLVQFSWQLRQLKSLMWANKRVTLIPKLHMGLFYPVCDNHGYAHIIFSVIEKVFWQLCHVGMANGMQNKTLTILIHLCWDVIIC